MSDHIKRVGALYLEWLSWREAHPGLCYEYWLAAKVLELQDQYEGACEVERKHLEEAATRIRGLQRECEADNRAIAILAVKLADCETRLATTQNQLTDAEELAQNRLVQLERQGCLNDGARYPYAAGRDCGRNLISFRSQNPYDPSTAAYRHWDNGWLDAREQLARDRGER